MSVPQHLEILRAEKPPVVAPLAPHTSPRRSLIERVSPYVSIARVDHWNKNVFMALGVVLSFFCHPELFGAWTAVSIAVAVLATCLIASSNYVLNEILDAPTDRSHPVKKQRPIPAGEVMLPLAYAEWIGLGAAGLGLAWAINVPFFLAGAWLLVMGLIYNVPPVRAKELPYVDVLTESINNPIRLLLGWFAVTSSEFPPVSLLLSYWFVGAFFMASKRFSEFRMIADKATAGAYRKSFRYYDEQRLLTSMFFYVTCFALFLGIFIIRYHLELILVVPLIAGFISYYMRIAFKSDSAAQAPEKLYREKGLMIYLIVCVAAFTALMFVQVPALYDWFNVVPSKTAPLWKI